MSCHGVVLESGNSRYESVTKLSVATTDAFLSLTEIMDHLDLNIEPRLILLKPTIGNSISY